MSRGGKLGRPETVYVLEAMEEICSFFEKNDHCKHVLSYLLYVLNARILHK